MKKSEPNKIEKKTKKKIKKIIEKKGKKLKILVKKSYFFCRKS